MSTVVSYTREQWEQGDGWQGVPAYADGVILLFRDDDYAEDDVLPICVRLDPATSYKPWPEDAGPHPDVPFQYWQRSDSGNGFTLIEEGADQSAHTSIIVRRQMPIAVPLSTACERVKPSQHERENA